LQKYTAKPSPSSKKINPKARSPNDWAETGIANAQGWAYQGRSTQLVIVRYLVFFSK